MADPCDAPLSGPADAEQVFQSLYRRYRPQRFAEVLGQEHVTRALINAVRDAKVAHAYLFSGPRGTGKTSTARILAMALNCEHPSQGEPDGTCSSCVEIRRGASLDVHELDAASNRKLDEMRDLLSRVALGARGRWKVYIVDEVHQLTADAASALLKTLEEPPAHVVFVLATTDPQKVLPTIRSRTQHFEFRLLSSDVLGDLLRDVNGKAALGVPPEAIDLVVRRGHGSARDALSVLDQVAAAGTVEDEATVVGEITDALADRDAGRVLVAVAEAMSAGHDPRRLGTDLLGHLRNGFLATQARQLVLLADDAVAEVEAQARRLGLPGVVRAMEEIGQALADMRDSVDPRVTLEVALVRIAHPGADASPAAVLERLERLERRLDGVPAASPPPPGPPPPPTRSPAPDPAARPAPPGGAAPVGAIDSGAPSTAESSLASSRAALGAPQRRPAASSTPPVRSVPPARSAAPARSASPGQSPPLGRPGPSAQAGGQGTGTSAMPSRDDLTTAWGDAVLPSLRAPVRAFLASGRFVDVETGTAVYALPDAPLLPRAQTVKGEAEAALTAHFGYPVAIRLIHDSKAPPGAGNPPDPVGHPETSGAPDNTNPPTPTPDIPTAGYPGARHPADDDADRYDLDELRDAGPAVMSPEQRLLEAFPGAQEVNP
ncbi:MAG TPA: DNA polymerase III subunit gamma/tau [Acidimicrobiales bacterium]|nr:DNA polymerase III subunit gamma/tau [Acidimicrobiales bacterium]